MDKRLGGEGGLGLPRRGDSCLQPGRGFLFYVFIFKDFIYSFLERGEGREKERERNISVWLPLTWPPLGTWPATQACADWELNLRPFSSQPSTQSTEPQQPGLVLFLNLHLSICSLIV